MAEPDTPGAGEPPAPADRLAPPTTPREIDRRLLEMLVCPLTKSTLQYRRDTDELISRQARLAYPIVDGIPLMTEDAARNLTDEDLARS